MQKRQYYKDPFMQELDTKVLTSRYIDGNYHVELENTIFYPEGGGQPADTGLIDAQKVLDVYEKQGRIYHVISAEPKGIYVKCRLDWDRRFYHMQHHTGQHLMSAVFYHQYNYQTCGFHLGTDYATIDISTPVLSDKHILAAETRINQLIYQNIPIRSYFPKAQDLPGLTLRKQPVPADTIRIVKLVGVDSVPCCGTHLTSTGQIGVLKIIKTEKYKSLTRIYFLCGLSAFRDFQSKHRTVVTLANSFSASETDVVARVTGEIETNRTLTHNYRRLQRHAAFFHAKVAQGQANNNIVIVTLEPEHSSEYAQLLAETIAGNGDYISAVIQGKRLTLASDGIVNCGKFMKENLANFNGRGGGNANLAQAYFPRDEDIQRFIDMLQQTWFSTNTSS